MYAALWAAVSWIFRVAVVNFLVMAALFVVVSELMPVIFGWIGAYVSTSALNSAFTSIPAGGWYFLDLFRFDVGLPLLISAGITKFLIRRLPFVG